MVSFSHLLQRQQVYRPHRLYPGKLPQPYHQILHGASTPPLFKTHSWARLGGHGASVKLFMLIAVVLSLVLCFVAAAAWNSAHSQKTAADGQSAPLVARPASWAGTFMSFAARASGKSVRHNDVSDGSVFEIAVTAAPAEQKPPAQTVPSNEAAGMIDALIAAEKEQTAHAMGAGKAASSQLPAQAATVELPPSDPACEVPAVAYPAVVFA